MRLVGRVGFGDQAIEDGHELIAGNRNCGNAEEHKAPPWPSTRGRKFGQLDASASPKAPSDGCGTALTVAETDLLPNKKSFTSVTLSVRP